MLSNFKSIVSLQNQVRQVQLAQTKLNALLDTLKTNQSDFATMLDGLEASLDQLPKRGAAAGGMGGMGGGMESGSGEELAREQAFNLAEDIDASLLTMADQLSTCVESLNSHTERAIDPSNPLSAVVKILNVHQNSLNWIEQNAQELQTALNTAQRGMAQMQVQDPAQMRLAARMNEYGYDNQWQRQY